MALLKDGALAEDPWAVPGEAEELPAEAPAFVSLERWQAERERLLGRNAPLGLRLRSEQSPDALAGELHRFAAIALEFPRFQDGRAYSHARRLRERHGYRGEIRAVGQVLRDQLLFMQRCGFDAFEIAADEPVEAWLAAMAEFSVFYQPAADGSLPAWRRRRAGGRAAGRTGEAA